MMAFGEEDGARAKKEEAVPSVETCVRTEMSAEGCVTLLRKQLWKPLLTDFSFHLQPLPLLVSRQESEPPSGQT